MLQFKPFIISLLKLISGTMHIPFIAHMHHQQPAELCLPVLSMTNGALGKRWSG